MKIKEKILDLLSRKSGTNIDRNETTLPEPEANPEPPASEGQPEMTYQTNDQADTSALREKVIGKLREVFDPEIPVNIYELGLIYAMNIDSLNNVEIHMTLTAPGCPVAPMIIRQVETMVGSIPEIEKVIVELVWDPPWTEDMMTDEAKLEVGIL